MRTIVTRHDPFTDRHQAWYFAYNETDHILELTQYYDKTGNAITRGYAYYIPRVYDFPIMSRDDVPLPDEIITHAKAQLTGRIIRAPVH